MYRHIWTHIRVSMALLFAYVLQPPFFKAPYHGHHVGLVYPRSMSCFINAALYSILWVYYNCFYYSLIERFRSLCLLFVIGSHIVVNILVTILF